MALVPTAFYTDMVIYRAASPFPFLGINFDRVALALGSAISSWAIGQPQNVALLGASAGTVGVGAITVVTTRILVPPNPAIAIGGMASAGLVGPLGVALGTVVGQAVPQTFSTVGQYTGASAGVANGVDVTKVVVANTATLIPILVSTLLAMSGPGPLAPQMALGLATAVTALLLTGTGIGQVVGPPSLTVGTGVTQSVMV